MLQKDRKTSTLKSLDKWHLTVALVYKMNGPSSMAGRDILDITHMSPKSAVGSTRIIIFWIISPHKDFDNRQIPIFTMNLSKALVWFFDSEDLGQKALVWLYPLDWSFASLSKSQISYQPKQASDPLILFG